MNTLAGISGDIPPEYDPLQWKIIASGVHSKNPAMYTLYGNDVAVQYARAKAEGNYPNGAILALVTWQRQEDPRWFGAEIPAQPNSVEVLEVTGMVGRSTRSYRLYEGRPLKELAIPHAQVEARVAQLLSLRPAVLP